MFGVHVAVVKKKQEPLFVGEMFLELRPEYQPYYVQLPAETPVYFLAPHEDARKAEPHLHVLA